MGIGEFRILETWTIIGKCTSFTVWVILLSFQCLWNTYDPPPPLSFLVNDVTVWTCMQYVNKIMIE